MGCRLSRLAGRWDSDRSRLAGVPLTWVGGRGIGWLAPRGTTGLGHAPCGGDPFGWCWVAEERDVGESRWVEVGKVGMGDFSVCLLKAVWVGGELE